MQDCVQTLQQPNNNGTTELHGIMNDTELDLEVTQQLVIHEYELLNEALNLIEPIDNSAKLKGVTITQSIQIAKQYETDTVGVDGIMKNSMQTPDVDNFAKPRGVMTTQNVQVAEQHDTDTVGVTGVMKNSTQTLNNDKRNAEQNELETLPDLVLNENSTVNEANTTEDEDEAAEALLQLSKLDILPEEDTELPLGVLQVDAAPVPIALGNQDVLNAIENFKQKNGETGIPSNNDVPKTPGDVKQDNNEKENKNKDKKDDTEPQSAPESSSLTSPAKGNLVIMKHGIRRKKSMKRTYKCARCDKCKNSTQELNKHYRLKHKPLMCGICNKLFDLPGTLKNTCTDTWIDPLNVTSVVKAFTLSLSLATIKWYIGQSVPISAWHRIVAAVS